MLCHCFSFPIWSTQCKLLSHHTLEPCHSPTFPALGIGVLPLLLFLQESPLLLCCVAKLLLPLPPDLHSVATYSPGYSLVPEAWLLWLFCVLLFLTFLPLGVTHPSAITSHFQSRSLDSYSFSAFSGLQPLCFLSWSISLSSSLLSFIPFSAALASPSLQLGSVLISGSLSVRADTTMFCSSVPKHSQFLSSSSPYHQSPDHLFSWLFVIALLFVSIVLFLVSFHSGLSSFELFPNLPLPPILQRPRAS